MTTVQTEPTAEERAVQARTDYSAGLRKLADLLDQHPQIPTPNGIHNRISIYTSDADAFNEVAALLGRPYSTVLRDDYLWVIWRLEGLELLMMPKAADVCERIVTGTVRVGAEVRETVEIVVPDRFLPATAEAVSA
jgi:hypothetical protein